MTRTEFLSMSKEQLGVLQEVNLSFTLSDWEYGDMTPIDIGNAEWQQFCEAISQCAAVKVIDLSVNALGFLSALRWQTLGGALAQLPSLRRINLESNMLHLLEGDSQQAFCAALAQCTALQSINFGHHDEQLAYIATEKLRTDLAQHFIINIESPSFNLIRIDDLDQVGLGYSERIFYNLPSLTFIHPNNQHLQKLAITNRLRLRTCFASDFMFLKTKMLPEHIAARVMTFQLPSCYTWIIAQIANHVQDNFVESQQFSSTLIDDKHIKIRYSELRVRQLEVIFALHDERIIKSLEPELKKLRLCN